MGSNGCVLVRVRSRRVCFSKFGEVLVEVASVLVEIEDQCKPRPRRQPRVEQRPGIRLEMSLSGSGNKEFPFTVAMYDKQRVGEQKGKGFKSARNVPSSSGFLCSALRKVNYS